MAHALSLQQSTRKSMKYFQYFLLGLQHTYDFLSWSCKLTPFIYLLYAKSTPFIFVVRMKSKRLRNCHLVLSYLVVTGSDSCGAVVVHQEYHIIISCSHFKAVFCMIGIRYMVPSFWNIFFNLGVSVEEFYQ